MSIKYFLYQFCIHKKLLAYLAQLVARLRMRLAASRFDSMGLAHSFTMFHILIMLITIVFSDLYVFFEEPHTECGC